MVEYPPLSFFGFSSRESVDEWDLYVSVARTVHTVKLCEDFWLLAVDSIDNQGREAVHARFLKQFTSYR